MIAARTTLFSILPFPNSYSCGKAYTIVEASRRYRSKPRPGCILSVIEIFRQSRSQLEYNALQTPACMDALNLNTSHQKVPASQFPEPADTYVCDRCGRDITKYFYRGHAHAQQPIGPIRYTCQCGQSYLSGKTEWDYLSNWAKRQRLMEFVLALILSAGFAGFAILAYFAFAHRSAVLLTLAFILLALSIPLLPLYQAILAIPVEIAASLWRTRIRGKKHAE